MLSRRMLLAALPALGSGCRRRFTPDPRFVGEWDGDEIEPSDTDIAFHPDGKVEMVDHHSTFVVTATRRKGEWGVEGAVLWMQFGARLLHRRVEYAYAFGKSAKTGRQTLRLRRAGSAVWEGFERVR